MMYLVRLGNKQSAFEKKLNFVKKFLTSVSGDQILSELTFVNMLFMLGIGKRASLLTSSNFEQKLYQC